MTCSGFDDLICLEAASDITLTSISPALIWLDDLAKRFHLSEDKLLPGSYLTAGSLGMENDVQY